MKRIIILGGGPAGYVAAIRAAQLGADVHLVEQRKLGGTCLNEGCIPTKALLRTAEIYRIMKRSSLIGLKADNLRVDWKALQSRKQSVVSRLVKGVESLIQANQIILHQGRGVLTGEKRVQVEGTILEGDALILATGSQPFSLPVSGMQLPGVVDSSGALSFPELPKSLVIVGGGVIGIEFASLFSSFGAEVMVLELQPEILPGVDQELAAKLKQELIRNGVEFRTNAKLQEISRDGDRYAASFVKDGNIAKVQGEYILMAVGRRAATEGLGLEDQGVALERGRILVNEHFETSVPGVYAIGDCNGQIMLAHAASAQGIAAVEHALGQTPQYRAETIPACLYTDPEAASVGLTEEQLKGQSVDYSKGVFPLTGNGKSVIEGGGSGMVKMLADRKSGRILGVHILGPRATDLIGEATLAIRMSATVDDLVSTIHAHPTVSESIGEAALASKGMSIHWPPQN